MRYHLTYIFCSPSVSVAIVTSVIQQDLGTQFTLKPLKGSVEVNISTLGTLY